MSPQSSPQRMNLEPSSSHFQPTSVQSTNLASAHIARPDVITRPAQESPSERISGKPHDQPETDSFLLSPPPMANSREIVSQSAIQLSADSLCHLGHRLRGFRLSREGLDVDLDSTINNQRNDRLAWTAIGTTSSVLLLMSSGMHSIQSISNISIEMIGKLAVAAALMGLVVYGRIRSQRQHLRARHPEQDPKTLLTLLSGAEALLVQSDRTTAHLLLVTAFCDAKNSSTRVWAAHLLLRAIEKSENAHERLLKLDYAASLIVACPKIREEYFHGLHEFSKGMLSEYLRCFDEVKFLPTRDAVICSERLKNIGQFLKRMGIAAYELREERFKKRFEDLNINSDMLFF